MAERLVVTAPLALMAMLLTTLLAFTLGLYAASRHGRPGDAGVMAASQLGVAIPNFWFAILLILVFAVKLRWFARRRLSEAGPRPTAAARPALRALVLPAVALAK